MYKINGLFKEDDTMQTALMYLFNDTNIHAYLTDSHRYIEDVSYLTSNHSNALLKYRSFSDSDLRMYSHKKPSLLDVLNNVRQSLKHSPNTICPLIAKRLNGSLTEIIRRSSIEHDISMAYMFKLIIKEVFIKGFRAPDNLSCRIYYTWTEKLYVFCYLVHNMAIINGILQRARKTEHSKYYTVNLPSALNYAREVLKNHSPMDIICDSLHSHYDGSLNGHI